MKENAESGRIIHRYGVLYSDNFIPKKSTKEGEKHEYDDIHLPCLRRVGRL